MADAPHSTAGLEHRLAVLAPPGGLHWIGARLELEHPEFISVLPGATGGEDDKDPAVARQHLRAFIQAAAVTRVAHPLPEIIVICADSYPVCRNGPGILHPRNIQPLFIALIGPA